MVELTALGYRLDLMVLMVSSNLNNSMILRFCGCNFNMPVVSGNVCLAQSQFIQ